MTAPAPADLAGWRLPGGTCRVEGWENLLLHDAVRSPRTDDAERGWTDHVREVGDVTLYPQANSWYMGADVPGKPRVFMASIGGVGAYRQHCDQLAADGYTGFAFSAP